ncbi:hypothetical protein AB5B87_003286 [Providencia rettgeri]|uniref:glycosyltransferase family 52 n=1 Tax=Providencia rettgeri TaxID=587 RepID=UPI002882807D|nr:hypothetical protein [Providencia rettgeri]ELM3938420.1 hypothetical protein [Providencia rettgeri]EMA4646042.1 hypothetical protein [Providencia rettgeri]MDK3110058.1 glycosyltransferase family 52 [Providencia rettgeri]WRR97110.1 glycosyltransferase family 52 [Providencia rettgeri]
MDLVICNTPLQAIQIENLIKNGILKKGNFELIFFIYNETEKLKHYYNRLSKLSYSSLYYKYEKFPFYVLKLKKLFNKKNYNSIYTASIDNKLTHYILSFSDYNYLYTIDDGTANIWVSSSYYIERNNIVKSAIHYLLGCRFNLKKTKEKTKHHYTIYKDFPNIVKNTIYNDIFDKKNNSSYNGKSINIFLGTVYDEVTNEKENLINDLSDLFSKYEFHYIPHPRDNGHYFLNVKYIEDNRISEEIISTIFDKYEHINLYGFGSSVQYNLLNIPGINNYQIESKYLKNTISIANGLINKINLN